MSLPKSYDAYFLISNDIWLMNNNGMWGIMSFSLLGATINNPIFVISVRFI